ncbi:hypothetical protein Xen7305DRAFT_00021340 [Xenococcus sp. PCC 7305]|uniref:hypothetical protein n=1 Tax=Xenococcus sp. PCC 7305 TaxID=102125 RepID=UPI0002ACF5FB|nr:hypothetical protein [Xenococcus sp. PCC 7305]ELS02420.1 hypothetical protein Xen7305DRAFT_00021340 [Xenococcus sp. PCC 7305]
MFKNLKTKLVFGILLGISCFFASTGVAFAFDDVHIFPRRVQPIQNGDVLYYTDAKNCHAANSYFLLKANHRNKEEIYALILHAISIDNKVHFRVTCDEPTDYKTIEYVYVDYRE